MALKPNGNITRNPKPKLQWPKTRTCVRKKIKTNGLLYNNLGSMPGVDGDDGQHLCKPQPHHTKV